MLLPPATRKPREEMIRHLPLNTNTSRSGRQVKQPDRYGVG